MKAENIVEEISSIKIFDTGYGYLLSKDFDYLVHPTLDNNNNFRTISDGQYNSIGEEMEREELGIVETSFGGGETKLMSFAKLIDGKILVLTVPEKEILADMYNIMYIILVVMIIAIGISIFFCIICRQENL